MRLFPTLIIIMLVAGISLIAGDKNEYVGVKTCGMCHKKADQGEQLKIWQESAHSKAYKTLQSEEANKIAAEKGLGKAVEAKECLECHVTAFKADASLLGKRFKVEDGVQCESCHGAGSKYKSKKVMKDHAKSVAAGMTDYKNEKDIEKQCITCHNDKSPSFKDFKFKEMWAKIKHPVPDKG